MTSGLHFLPEPKEAEGRSGMSEANERPGQLLAPMGCTPAGRDERKGPIRSYTPQVSQAVGWVPAVAATGRRGRGKGRPTAATAGVYPDLVSATPTLNAPRKGSAPQRTRTPQPSGEVPHRPPMHAAPMQHRIVIEGTSRRVAVVVRRFQNLLPSRVTLGSDCQTCCNNEKFTTKIEKNETWFLTQGEPCYNFKLRFTSDGGNAKLGVSLMPSQNYRKSELPGQPTPPTPPTFAAFLPFANRASLTSREAAKAIGISESHLRHHRVVWGIPHLKLGESVVYPTLDLLAWLHARAVQTLESAAYLDDDLGAN